MKKITIAFLLSCFSIGLLFSQGPYIWGCKEWLYQIGGQRICMEQGYVTAPEELNICYGETESLYACIPGTCPDRTYQWSMEYMFEVKPGTWGIFRGPITGATDNELILSLSDLPRTYWCRIIYSGDTTYTGDVTVTWHDTITTITQNLSDEIVCLNDQMKLNFGVEGTNNYTWQVKPPGGAWTNIPDENSHYYYFYPALTDNNNQYKCIASNSCWDGPAESNPIKLTVNNIPAVNLGDDMHICEGHSLELDAGPDPKSYTWNTGENQQSISVDTSGAYSVTVTNLNNCENSDTIIITVDPAIAEVNLGEDLRICLKDSATLDAGPGYDHYTWSNQQNSQQITVRETGNYWVEVSNNNSVCLESDTVHIEVAKPYPDEEICLITVDMATGNNIIVWEKTEDMGILAYNIYRQTTTAGKYELMETIPYNNLSIYMDEEADPEVRQWIYKITVIDTCNNESDIIISPYHKPIFLSYNGVDDGVFLNWESYEVEGKELEFLTYEIYRGLDSLALTYLDEVSGDLKAYKDKDPDALKYKYYYRVAGVKSVPCYPSDGKKADSGSYSHAMSNQEDNRLKIIKGTDEFSPLTLSVYPNPFSNSATIRFLNPEGAKYYLYVRDLSGKVVRVVSDITSDEIEFFRNDLSPGVYMVEIKGRKLFLGKLIIH